MALTAAQCRINFELWLALLVHQVEDLTLLVHGKVVDVGEFLFLVRLLELVKNNRLADVLVHLNYARFQIFLLLLLDLTFNVEFLLNCTLISLLIIQRVFCVDFNLL